MLHIGVHPGWQTSISNWFGLLTEQFTLIVQRSDCQLWEVLGGAPEELQNFVGEFDRDGRVPQEVEAEEGAEVIFVFG